MAFTDEQITKLREALASGTLRVRFADREVTYRSVSEIKEALATAESQATGARPIVQYLTKTRSGLE